MQVYHKYNLASRGDLYLEMDKIINQVEDTRNLYDDCTNAPMNCKANVMIVL